MTDIPVGVTDDGRLVYDNAASVVCVLVPLDSKRTKLLGIRRSHEPGKGLLGLPGGYQMYGETWQDAGRREVQEETGYLLSVSNKVFTFRSIETDEYNNNLIIVEAPWVAYTSPSDDEAEEILWIDASHLDPALWAFPKHFNAVREFFEGKKSKRMDEGL